MWTLYVVPPNLLTPIVIEGYTSKNWAETAGKEAVQALGGYFWATKRPMDNPTPAEEVA